MSDPADRDVASRANAAVIAEFLPPRAVAAGMFACVVVMTFLSVTGHAAQFFLGADAYVEFVRLFNISGEGNIPTWFSSMGLAGAGLLCALIAWQERARGRRRWLRHWRVLAAALIYVSVDELSQIHELAIEPLQRAWNTGGLLYFAWVIPGTALVLAFALAYRRFLCDLPGTTRCLLAASGAIYACGALGMEMVSGVVAEDYGDNVLLRGGVATLEEFLEMSGITLLVAALLRHVRDFGRPADGEDSPVPVAPAPPAPSFPTPGADAPGTFGHASRGAGSRRAGIRG